MTSAVKPSQAEVEEKRYQRGQWKEQEIARVRNWDTDTYPPAWMTLEITEALNAIEGPYLEKKRTTVLRLAEGLSSGVPIRDLLNLSDTCDGSVWYGRPSRDKTGWKDDPHIKAAYEAALQRAFWWKEQEKVQRITLRHRQLGETEDELVDMTKLALETLGELMASAESEKVRLEAAAQILDRADEVTAVKSMQSMEHSLVTSTGPTMSAIKRRRRQRDGAIIHDDIPEDDLESLPPPPPGGGDVSILPEPDGGNGSGEWQDVGEDEEYGWIDEKGEPVEETA
jgi:hypothetical protein